MRTVPRMLIRRAYPTANAGMTGARARSPSGGFDTHIRGATIVSSMPDAAMLRDSTQILLPESALAGLRDELEARFTLTIRCEDDFVRLVGSPVEIKAASEFLARNGISVQ
jgi:hypothetical protein